MTDGLFITSMFWLGGSIVILWRASVLAISRRAIYPFLSFFFVVIVMDTTAAFIYYGSWMTDTWVVIRVLWLCVFIFFLVMWIRLIRRIMIRQSGGGDTV